MPSYNKPTQPHNYLIDLFNFKSLITYAAAAKKPLKIYTYTRHYIGDFKAIDHPNPPIIINNFWISGGLIYSRSGYNTRTISHDEILKIEVLKNAA